MGRRKQRQPKRSKAVILESDGASGTQFNEAKQNAADVDEPYYVQVRKTNWVSNEHRDLSEVVLSNLKLGEGYSGFIINEDFYQESRFGIRLRVMNVNRSTLDRIKLGHWPLLPSSNVSLELIERKMIDNGEVELVIVSGIFDGPDEGITAVVHLVSMGFLSVRPVLGVELSDSMKSLRVRVEILWAAFDACESLLEVTRQVWKKSMMNLIAWLRPEVMSSEARYGVTKSREMDVDLIPEMEDNTHNFRKNARLDVAGFYEAIKPSKSDPVLEDDLPNLLPMLRPYQRRAAYWMLQQENVASRSLNEKERAELFSPFCFPLSFLDTSSKMFYNPFSGNVSLQPEYFSLNVPGGILADEMGLGKTVELLACIFAHRRLASEGDFSDDGQQQHNIDAKVKRLKMERVECICGAVSESYRYKGLWVQCDVCDAWQHADCVGYSPRGKRKKSAVEVQKNRKKTTISFVERDGEHVCQMCSELMEATVSPILSGATLIVCPAPILSQWQAEIERHTRPGSVKTCVYEGVRDASFSCTSTMDIEELLSADIVLTTYDVLKEDLSHDSDRHEGDRHILRFQKRYPVIPTPLTRIFWWRICLDEAQMVESNACAATEMALRLSTKFRWCVTGTPIQRKLDDLYGLLRFLKASPFNVSRWWTEIIRDPYEKGDKAAITFTHKFFKNIMWRSSKVHVADELLLPPQEENLSWLTFSAIEEHFYERQHESCVNYARELIESFKSSNSKRKAEDSAHSGASLDPLITHAEAAKLLNSLLKLRQACCHPQVGSSGLRSVQQSPMTMEEILMVLIGKTKVEGEEALRKLVVALNALAGVATIKQEYTQAASLYKEALFVSEEHSEDFRVDPLLNIHIHHNLAEVLSLVTDCSTQSTLNRQQCHERSEKASKVHNIENCDATAAKRQKVSGENDYADEARSLCEQSGPSLKAGDDELNVSCDNLRTNCEKLKQKYLSVFSAKLAVARQDFRKSNMQVCNAFNDRKAEDTTWWLDALHHVEQNRDLSSELIGKVEEAVTGTKGNSRSSRTASCFQSISALKYHVQVRLDQLETSRKTLLDQLLEIDETMDNPKEKDVERVRYCRICQAVDGGVVCIHCELDGLFKDYEARLFRLNKLHGEIITSAEEAVDLQNKKSELNRFYWNLSGRKKNLSSVSDDLEESTKRGGGESVVVSKSPSDMEVILGVIKNYCKAKFGSECVSAASKQLQMLESMRKEYGHARSLAVAQAQVLLAHDEIKMATSRLHLKEDENDQSVDALSLEELDSASVVHSSEKFMSLTELSSIKGKLRYLKGLVQTKRKLSPESSSDLLSGQQKAIMTTATGKISERLANNDEEACPICQEKLNNQKMVFQCGHVTCCKCFFELTERKEHDYKFQRKWVMCPTCRQHTDFGNIAYADDRQEKCSSSTMTNIAQGAVEFEAALTVQGSYSTKVEAVTRRILWIKSSDSKAKVLVFSSWNDVLDVLEHAFNANAITYIRMKGGRKSHVAISKFKGKKNSEKVTSNVHDQQEESKSVQVLLLLIQHGANGLNLLEAQHVVLVEPLLNPAVEAQAISRVHRIGQENKTIVHRFIVKDTVEESIYKLNRSRNMSSFISGNTKNQDQPVLTVKDVECLFGTVNSKIPQSGKQTASLRDLPPSTAAAIAAERRLKQIESGSRL